MLWKMQILDKGEKGMLVLRAIVAMWLMEFLWQTAMIIIQMKKKEERRDTEEK